MLDTAESVLQDYRHGFERADDGGVGTADADCIVGECAKEGVFSRDSNQQQC